MSNVSVEGPVVIFRSGARDIADEPAPPSSTILIAREAAERAAAKNSRSVAARRAHQELAQIYAARRLSETR